MMHEQRKPVETSEQVGIRPKREADWLDGAALVPARNVGGRPAKDYRARGNRKLECPQCGFIARCSAAAIERAGGLPTCGCGRGMIVPNLRDRAAIEWDALAAELESYGRNAYDAAMRELGHVDMIAPRRSTERHGGAQRRCEVNGCHKFSAGRYCAEHEHDRPEMAAAHRSM